jgi:hypothetical protein
MIQALEPPEFDLEKLYATPCCPKVQFDNCEGLKPFPAFGRLPYRPIGKDNLVKTMAVPKEPLAYGPARLDIAGFIEGLSRYDHPHNALNYERAWEVCVEMSDRMKAFMPIDKEELIMEMKEALESVDRSKSPGWPYYYFYKTNGEVIDALGDKPVAMWFADLIISVFSGTLKPELRQLLAGGKTKLARLFASGPFHLNVAGEILFGRQNEAFNKSLLLGFHPSTIGISVPGAQFKYALLHYMREYPYASALDGEKFDANFLLFVILCICYIRKTHLPMRVHHLVDRYYAHVYLGFYVAKDINGMCYIIRLLLQKSGQKNTGHDNMLLSWFIWLYALLEVGYNMSWIRTNFRFLNNGDDLVVGFRVWVDLNKILATIRSYGLGYSADREGFTQPCELQFLSTSVVCRYVAGVRYMVCAGNLEKLVASIYFVKKSDTMTYNQSVLAHWIGLRTCMFPWPAWFEFMNDLLEGLVKQMRGDPRLGELLKACLSERSLLGLHYSWETGY